MVADDKYHEHVRACSKVGEFLGLLLVSWLTGRQAVITVEGGAETPDSDTLLSRKQAAKQLCISLTSLDKLRREGRLVPAKGLKMRMVRYHQADVDRLKHRKRE